MKNQRQEIVKTLITQYDIETQDELIARLRAEGYMSTQATISRDIRELKISKVMGTNGKYHYVLSKDVLEKPARNPYVGSVTDIQAAGNIVVIKTHPGLAQAVAAGIDSVCAGEILGCVAGDDTILAVVHDEKVAVEFSGRLKTLVGVSDSEK